MVGFSQRHQKLLISCACRHLFCAWHQLIFCASGHFLGTFCTSWGTDHASRSPSCICCRPPNSANSLYSYRRNHWQPLRLGQVLAHGPDWTIHGALRPPPQTHAPSAASRLSVSVLRECPPMSKLETTCY